MEIGTSVFHKMMTKVTCFHVSCSKQQLSHSYLVQVVNNGKDRDYHLICIDEFFSSNTQGGYEHLCVEQ